MGINGFLWPRRRIQLALYVIGLVNLYHTDSESCGFSHFTPCWRF